MNGVAFCSPVRQPMQLPEDENTLVNLAMSFSDWPLIAYDPIEAHANLPPNGASGPGCSAHLAWTLQSGPLLRANDSGRLK